MSGYITDLDQDITQEDLKNYYKEISNNPLVGVDPLDSATLDLDENIDIDEDDIQYQLDLYQKGKIHELARLQDMDTPIHALQVPAHISGSSGSSATSYGAKGQIGGTSGQQIGKVGHIPQIPKMDSEKDKKIIISNTQKPGNNIVKSVKTDSIKQSQVIVNTANATNTTNKYQKMPIKKDSDIVEKVKSRC